MTLAIGSRLGPYEIVAALGAGGMGEVYRGRDTELNRDVALKVLRESVAEDPDRLARFKREAQVRASLNHPHVGAIYGVADFPGGRALVLELVEGEISVRASEGRPSKHLRCLTRRPAFSRRDGETPSRLRAAHPGAELAGAAEEVNRPAPSTRYM